MTKMHQKLKRFCFLEEQSNFRECIVWELFKVSSTPKIKGMMGNKKETHAARLKLTFTITWSQSLIISAWYIRDMHSCVYYNL